MDCAAAIVIGFFVLNDERNNETETLVPRYSVFNIDLCYKLYLNRKSLAKLKKQIIVKYY